MLICSPPACHHSDSIGCVSRARAERPRGDCEQPRRTAEWRRVMLALVCDVQNRNYFVVDQNYFADRAVFFPFVAIVWCLFLPGSVKCQRIYYISSPILQRLRL